MYKSVPEQKNRHTQARLALLSRIAVLRRRIEDENSRLRVFGKSYALPYVGQQVDLIVQRRGLMVEEHRFLSDLITLLEP